MLDLSRSVSRVGRGPLTGIDRVEAAYLGHLLAEPGELFGLVRTSLGQVLLDKAGMRRMHARIYGAGEGGSGWGPADLLSRVLVKNNPDRQRAESDLRRMCIGRSRRSGLAALLARHLPSDVTWLNVGHTNLDPRIFAAVKAIGGRAQVLVHDVIPLDHPEWQRPGTVERFRERMRTVARHADLVVYNSGHSRVRAEHHFRGWGRVPPAIVAHLGVTVAAPDRRALPASVDLSQPFFVTIGTIEPRKNHALLLDVWEKLAQAGRPPTLYVIGTRGWNNDAVFRRLDARPPGVVELTGLGDGAMSALVAHARAALFPSLAEGFGLPACEAVMLGTRVVATDLPATREILGQVPIYPRGPDLYPWLQTIKDLTEEPPGTRAQQTGQGRAVALPKWSEHFNKVLSVS